MTKYYIILILLFISLQSCKDQMPTFEGSERTMEMDFGASTSISEGTELFNAVKHLRIYLFNNNRLVSEVASIERVDSSVKFRMPVGTWTIVGVSSLEATAPSFQIEYGASLDQLLYTYTYSAAGLGADDSRFNLGADAPQIVKFKLVDQVITNQAAGYKADVSFKRMVGKVTVAITDYSANVKVNGGHTVEINGIPTKLSFTGGLLNELSEHSRTSPDTLDSGLYKMVRQLTIAEKSAEGVIPPDDAKRNKSTFIIPAWHDYESSVGLGNNKLGVVLNIELITAEGEAKKYYVARLKTSDMEKSLAANRELFISINVNATTEVETDILPWSSRVSDGDIHGAELLAPTEVRLDWALLGNSYSTKPLKVKGSHDISMKTTDLNGAEIVFPFPVNSGTVNIPNKPSWLQATANVITAGKEVDFTFTYTVDATPDKKPYVITIKCGNITKTMSIIYDNGYISEELMNSAVLSGSYREVSKLSSAGEAASGVQNRNSWALGGFHLARRGWAGHEDGSVTALSATKGIDPFTDNTRANVSSDAISKNWQINTDAAGIIGIDEKKYNTGYSNTKSMSSTNKFPVARYCNATGADYYVPGVSELQWISDYAHKYLGESYTFASTNYYWTSTQYLTSQAFLSNVPGQKVSAKTKVSNEAFFIRCIKDITPPLITPNEVLMDWARLGRSFSTKPVKVIGQNNISIRLPDASGNLGASTTIVSGTSQLENLPTWLTAASVTFVSSKELEFNFTYKIDGTQVKKSYDIEVISGSNRRVMSVIYDNGYMSAALMNGELKDTYKVPGYSQDYRSGWAKGGVHLSRRGWADRELGVVERSAAKGIDPFTDNSSCCETDPGPHWQSALVLSGLFPDEVPGMALKKMEYNEGFNNTKLMYDKHNKNVGPNYLFPAAKFCQETGAGYYIPTRNELYWVCQIANPYLGASYRYLDGGYATSSEYIDETYDIWVFEDNGIDVTRSNARKNSNFSTRCIKNM